MATRMARLAGRADRITIKADRRTTPNRLHMRVEARRSDGSLAGWSGEATNLDEMARDALQWLDVEAEASGH